MKLSQEERHEILEQLSQLTLVAQLMKEDQISAVILSEEVLKIENKIRNFIEHHLLNL